MPQVQNECYQVVTETLFQSWPSRLLLQVKGMLVLVLLTL